MSAPFMQLYVADYLGDTRHLTTEQHGAYLLLLMTMWRSEGVLPNDPKKLARITGCTASRWARIADDVLAFFDIDGDTLTNKRLMLELKKASEKSIQRAVSGSLGGTAKALKTKEPAVAKATGLLCHSSEPEPDKKVLSPKGERRAPTGAPTGGRLPDDWLPQPDDLQAAMSKLGPTVPDEIDKFRDYWRAVPGAKGRKLDWDATFRNWIRRSESPKNAKSDRFDDKQANYQRALTGAEWATDLMASRRDF